MRGFPWIENGDARRSSHAAAFGARMLLANVAVGVLAGLLVSHVRLQLGLPGHKALFWMVPVLAARLFAPHLLGATAGASAAACTALAMGENLAGGILYLPLVPLAGAVLDGTVALAERRRLRWWWTIPLLGMGGMAANLLCAMKRLLTPLRNSHLLFGLDGLAATILSYAFFGLLAGLAASTLAALWKAARAGGRGAPTV